MTYQDASKKHEQAISKMITECGIFFAFSDKQFEEGKKKTNFKEGDKLISVLGGGCLPLSNKDKYIKDSEKASEDFIKALKEGEEIKEQAIKYELANHECYYTGEIDAVVNMFKGIYTSEEILKVYQANYQLESANM